MAEAGYPAAIEYAEEEGHNCSATSFCCPSGQWPGFFLLKGHRSTPFHDVNVTQLIVIDYYYHAVVMLSCISTLTKVQKKGKQADEQKILF
ncbi:hypothetical protein GR306_30190 (plasmid) [Klebsiella pneumoniae]|nr:hypothetical protein GR306_30190 [Klebsiella pneumoniae]